MSGKGPNNNLLSTFYNFLILPIKVDKNEAENSRDVPIFIILWVFITMPYLYVCRMKIVVSWKKNDPILETRKIAL